MDWFWECSTCISGRVILVQYQMVVWEVLRLDFCIGFDGNDSITIVTYLHGS